MTNLEAEIQCEHNSVENTDFKWISQGFLEDGMT